MAVADYEHVRSTLADPPSGALKPRPGFAGIWQKAGRAAYPRDALHLCGVLEIAEPE